MKFPHNFITNFFYGGRNFQETFVLKRDWRYIIWKKKEIQIDNILYSNENYFES